MTACKSVYQAVMDYRLNITTGAHVITNTTESWWRECYFLADLICRDKIMRMLTNPNQMCTPIFFEIKTEYF